jgi:Mrp family chromosome partitioning ATPase
MSNEVNQAYLRAYVKSRAEGAPVRSRLPSSGGNPDSEPIRRPVTQRVDAGTQQVPAPNLPIASHRPTVSPTQKEMLRQEAAKSVEQPLQPQQSGAWSSLGVERGIKATGVFRAQPAVVVNGTGAVRHVVHDSDSIPQMHRSKPESTSGLRPRVTTAEAENFPGPMPSKSIEAPSQNKSSSSPRIRIDRAHSGVLNDRIRSEAAASSPVAHVPPASTQHPASDVVSSHLSGSRGGYVPQSSPVPSHQPIAPLVLATIPEAPAGIPKQNAIPQHNTTPQAARPGFPSEQTQHRRLDASHEVSTQRKPPVSQARAPEARTPLPLPVTFSASWEVDRFFWPEVAIQIAKSHGEAFQQIGKHLRLANQEGLKVMAVTSGERGVGRSTVAMHLARCAAAAGLSVALMDADTFYPSLVDQLRLDVEHGWQDCLFENVPLEEAAVRSIEDRITVFPLTSVVSAQQMHANLHRMSKIVKRIASAFDIVILDSNRLNLEQREMVGVSQESIVDAAIVVVDTELSIKEKVDTAVSILQGMGIASVGMVENFNG